MNARDIRATPAGPDYPPKGTNNSQEQFGRGEVIVQYGLKYVVRNGYSRGRIDVQEYCDARGMLPMGTMLKLTPDTVRTGEVFDLDAYYAADY